jgi:hypothetical protein
MYYVMEEYLLRTRQRAFAMRVIQGLSPAALDRSKLKVLPLSFILVTELYYQLLLKNALIALDLFPDQPTTFRERLYADLPSDAKLILDTAWEYGPLHPDLNMLTGGS